ncbi:MAG TPA: peptide-methionine (R)-S-oxide reductase MsrB [Candidatus Paceibacterota bacterium]|nr:peptide-methionine (R)-S-oxide reductase MsrB [Candidatus Paceibacterota bacterium]
MDTKKPETDRQDEWREKLTAEEYAVMRGQGTETPFTGKYWNEHGRGVYTCRGCGTALFSSETKFDSGTGWPSFEEPTNAERIELRRDTSHDMIRTEAICKKCGAHLGHVFDDWTTSSGKRYCINSVCLDLEKPEKGL